jgi:hypothetical protein
MKQQIQELINKLEEELSDLKKFNMSISIIEYKKQTIKDLKSILSSSQPD